MRHFTNLSAGDRARLFDREPTEFDRAADLTTLAASLGATLYMPATRRNLAQDIERQGAAGAMSVVVCLEDAIADEELVTAQANVVEQLGELARRTRPGDGPLVFIRVRHAEQIPAIVAGLGSDAHVLSGFVLPKFTESTGPAFLDAVADTGTTRGVRLLAMPVIESPEMIHLETRRDALLGVARILDKHRQDVLAVRMGATDLSGVYGIRRGRDLTIYDVRLVAEVVSDVVNVLGRADGTGFVVTGPVWEYFANNERLFKPQLRQSPFEHLHAAPLRQTLIRSDLDGLIREVILDQANGLTGKTVIHPSHVQVVHALSVVLHEDYCDALDVAGSGAGAGAASSRYRNKMNESKPHQVWAQRTLVRASAFGVAAEGVTAVDLLAASETA